MIQCVTILKVEEREAGCYAHELSERWYQTRPGGKFEWRDLISLKWQKKDNVDLLSQNCHIQITDKDHCSQDMIPCSHMNSLDTSRRKYGFPFLLFDILRKFPFQFVRSLYGKSGAQTYEWTAHFSRGEGPSQIVGYICGSENEKSQNRLYVPAALSTDGTWTQLTGQRTRFCYFG